MLNKLFMFNVLLNSIQCYGISPCDSIRTVSVLQLRTPYFILRRYCPVHFLDVCVSPIPTVQHTYYVCTELCTFFSHFFWASFVNSDVKF